MESDATCGLLDAGWLEDMIKRHEYMNSPSRVVAVEVEPAVPKGDNYMSDMIRATMVVRLQSGATVKKSVIIKRVPDSAMVSKVVQENRAFYTEIDNYKDVFPAMERLMDEFGDRGDKLWCKCLDYTPYSQLVLEDLKAQGFRMADRTKGLDLEHALLTVRSLAKFHTLSFVLLERGKLNVRGMRPCFLACRSPHMDSLICNSLRTLAKVIRNSWTPEWSHVADKLEAIAPSLTTMFNKLIVQHESSFKVLNHGDCWTNNLMFKYDSYPGRPVSMRFVDFQMSNYNSPAVDLIYLFYAGLQHRVKRQHRSELVAAYCRALRTYFDMFRPSGPPPGLPTEDSLEDELRRLTPVGIAVTCSFRPVMMGSAERAHDFEEVLSNLSSDDPDDDPAAVYIGEEVEVMLKEDLEEFVKIGCL